MYEPTTVGIACRRTRRGTANLIGGYQLFVTATRDHARIADAFRTGGGMLWGEHEDGVFEGTQRSSDRPTKPAWSQPGFRRSPAW